MPENRFVCFVLGAREHFFLKKNCVSNLFQKSTFLLLGDSFNQKSLIEKFLKQLNIIFLANTKSFAEKENYNMFLIGRNLVRKGANMKKKKYFALQKLCLVQFFFFLLLT